MTRSPEPSSEVFPDVTAEEGRCAEAAILANVRELVREEIFGGARALVDDRGGAIRQEDPATEDDRFGRGQRRQEPRERAAVEPRPSQLGRIERAEPVGEREGNALPRETSTNRRETFSAR